MAIGTVIFYPNYIHYAGYDVTAEPSVVTQNYACSGAETTGPAYDVVDDKRTAELTVDTSGETDGFTVDLDLTANITSADFGIIDNHNLLTAGAQVNITYGDDGGNVVNDSGNAYSGVLGSATTQYTANPYFDKPADGVMVIPFSSAQTENNWEFRFAYSLTNFSGDVTIGEIAIGVSFTPSIAPDINPIEVQNFDGVLVRRSKGGQNSSLKLYGERKSWQLNWSYISNTDKTGFQKVYEVTEGPRHPFWIDLGESATPQLYYVRFVANSLSIRKLTANAYEISVIIESEV